ncbi:hypothetical protein [Chitinophaga sp. Ak27]|uniref:hypothetical protein n=1 Tax=Chitinophaga sp. Ak27 TaxID=2726116 RepID=UPI00145F2A11|nr:hypothetical protein [Chitinophaga sp. Ak27]NLU94862.1 hypothetical protein [Chitinophaga sp. Ak27]
MKKIYAFEWLEELTSKLKPGEVQLQEDRTGDLIKEISFEKQNSLRTLRNQITLIKDEHHTETVVRKYYRAILLLIDKVYTYKEVTLVQSNQYTDLLEYLWITLNEIQQFIEVHYQGYLTQEERVPLPELLLIKADFLQRLPALRSILKKGKNTARSIQMVMDALASFIARIEKNELITLREAKYHVEFLIELERGETTILPDCPTLHEVLFVWNFNSFESLGYFTKEMQLRVDAKPTQEEKLQYMKFEFKRMLHLPAKPNTIYDKRYPSIKSYFTGWLEKEIEYLEQKTTRISPLSNLPSARMDPPKPYKVMVNLSSDQLGLLLKGFTDAQLLTANSMRAIFEDVVPRLSTPRKDELSWQNMRIKTYSPERKDVVRSVEALEKVIKIIQNY